MCGSYKGELVILGVKGLTINIKLISDGNKENINCRNLVDPIPDSPN